MLAAREASSFALAVSGANVQDGHFVSLGNGGRDLLLGSGARDEEDISVLSLGVVSLLSSAWGNH